MNTPEQQDQAETATPDNWERDLISHIALDALREQRRNRRWSIFFRFAMLVYFLPIVILLIPSDWTTKGISAGKHTALIEIKGVIAPDAEASADNIIGGLREAFKDDNTAGIILRINSPGGSPVQAGYVNDEIRRLRGKYPDIPVYAVIMDVCASGGYYIAAAADRIYADKASLVGSIGVRMDGFGFVEAMHKLGIERRLLTAGQYKGLLDPFSPVDPTVEQHIHGLLETIHRQFIDIVKQGRGKHLVDDERLYSGLIWTGEQGLELGLVDALGSSSKVAREVIRAEDIIDFTVREDYFDRFAKRLGTAMMELLGKAPVLR